MSKARAQTNLLGLPPRIQERILTGEVAGSERGVRAVAGETGWERQSAKLLERSKDLPGRLP